MDNAERHNFFIGGEWVAPAGTGRVEVVNPSDETILGTFPEASGADIERAVQAARAAFEDGAWSALPVTERIAACERIGQLVATRADELIPLIINEMGAPISGTGAAGQVLGVPVVVQCLTDAAKTFPWVSERANPAGGSSLVVHEPVGVVAGIIPWNGPLFLAVMKIVPALISGSTVVLKPAPETALDSYILAEIIEAAGLPPGVVSIVPAGREAGEQLVAHPDIDKVTFTGSTAAGSRIGEVCGRMFKRVALELGGKSAAIVLDDANIDVTIPGLVAGGLGNNGQQCFALSRVLVSKRRKDEVVEAMATAFKALQVGHAMDPDTGLGPLITAAHRDRVESYVRVGLDDGARLVTGGHRPPDLDRGWFLEPTLFSEVDNESRLAQEEIFGPVISIIEYDDEADAVAKANRSAFGLSGAVFTEDTEKGVSIGRRVRTGTFHVNHFGGNLAAPFGGFKASGVGREWGPEGLADFTELKTINLPR